MADRDDNTRMSILLIDDDDVVRVPIADFLAVRGHSVVQATDGSEALERLRDTPFDIVIADIRMPGADGFEVLRRVREQDSGAEVILMTGFGDIDTAVRAMREGAFDFFAKPVKMQELSASIERTERFHVLRRERDQARLRLARFESEARQRYGLSAFIGESSEVQAVKALVRQVCETEVTSVLIVGETGTGKEVIARAIHHESERAEGPFVAADCTAIPDALFESLFYGHEKGAFTDAGEMRKGLFEQADGGTLFLDEIGDLPAEMQARLLRTLEERCIRRVGGTREIPVRVRVVSATNRNLSAAVAGGAFRDDLYHRINTFVIYLPPLRQRPGDIHLLARHYLHRYAHEMGRDIRDFAPEALTRLQAYPFPGNVRELKNTIERAVILCRGDRIAAQDLQFTVASVPRDAPGTVGAPPADFSVALQSLPDASLELERVEAEVIREALRRSNGNRGEAAALLGVSRFALRRRMALFEIQ